MFDIDLEELISEITGGHTSKEGVDLSIVVTAHKEGMLAHKTMLSVFLGVKELIKEKYKYEIVIHIDKGDAETIKYFERYEGLNNFAIYKNSFGDSGMSRNYAAIKAKGKYVAFIDADDLCSANFFVRAVRMLEKSDEEIVVHANAILTFGVDYPNILSLEMDSGRENSDALQLIGANKWGSEIVGARATFLKCPYRKTEKGYGYEDYTLNVELLASGIPHRVAKETVRFYRRTDNSLLSSQNSQNMIIPYSTLFDFKKIKEKPIDYYSGIDKYNSLSTIDKVKQNKIYREIRGNKFLNYFITPFASIVVKRRLKTMKNDGVPEFVVEEWKNINRIETQLYPHESFLENLSWYIAENKVVVGRAYYELMKQVKRKPDYVFVVPWLIRGGGDKVILNYIKGLLEIYNDWHIVVIATDPDVESTWVDKLPDSVDFVKFGDCAKEIHRLEWDALMSVLITQLGCKRLHIINSMFGYEWAMKHKKLIEANYRLNVTLFAAEYIVGTDQRGIFGYDDPYLLNIINATRTVTTDNERMVDRMMAVDGFIDQGKFKVHYQPVVGVEKRSPKSEFVDGDKLHILWAGRVVSVKMPELVAAIGKKLDSNKFVIDVYGEMGKDVDMHIFDGISSINYHGSFDGFDSLPINDADILLYTSRSDGIPNIVLEATMAGLPIIASNDGGVGEVIKDGKTGILVGDMLNPDAYVEKLNSIKDIKVLQKFVRNAQKLIETRHSWEKFLQDIKKDLVDD